MKKNLLITLILLSGIISVGFAAKSGVTPLPKPPPVVVIPTTTATTELSTLSVQPSGGSTFALYFFDTKKVSINQELPILTAELAPYGLTPCTVNTDINYSPIICGKGLVSFGANELYTYGRPLNLQSQPITLDRGVKQVFAANFLSPVGLTPGDSIGRIVHVKFNKPITQFALSVDSGQASTTSIDAITYVVGTGASAVEITQPLTPGVGQWSGISLASGFTEVTIVPVGGTTGAQAFVLDQITAVPQ